MTSNRARRSTRVGVDIMLSRILGVIVTLALGASSIISGAELTEKAGTQWGPTIEWTVENPSWQGNAFDVVAKVRFVHQSSGQTRTTEMFYAGGTQWTFRFTGTRTGRWSFLP